MANLPSLLVSKTDPPLQCVSQPTRVYATPIPYVCIYQHWPGQAWPGPLLHTRVCVACCVLEITRFVFGSTTRVNDAARHAGASRLGWWGVCDIEWIAVRDTYT